MATPFFKFFKTRLSETLPCVFTLHSPLIRKVLLFHLQNTCRVWPLFGEWYCHHLVPATHPVISCLDFFIVQMSWYRLASPTLPLPLFSLFSSQKSVLLEEKSDILKTILWLPISFGINGRSQVPLTYWSLPTSFTQIQTLGIYSLLSVPSVRTVLPTTAILLEQEWFVPQRMFGNVRDIFVVMTQEKEVLLANSGLRTRILLTSLECIESPHNKKPSISKYQVE